MLPIGTVFLMQTVTELRARAEELRRMAETARTADTRDALIALSKRFEKLALRQSAEQAAGR